ncbi:hypothetical protein AURDEDRAFT_176918 [Auricularia subglabra TFB-10046 SS5]|uniref:UBC core domain-containing protein n=1 Tax=Auricularia subglabra (strain TFB-10046 / SS5) TaxID=717982 RepID=J0LC28_AURST|nr:hypothetical protein AURDEDRAFT_176918 [Auricularia subglabra TFB-10046 SS5]
MASALAIRRVAKDLQELRRNPDIGSCEPVDGDLTKLVAHFPGPKNSPYEEGTFTLDIRIPAGYPLDPPQIKFMHFVYHPNVASQSGEICVDILKPGNWSPTQSLRSIILSVSSLLADPNPDSPLEWPIAEQFKSDLPGYLQSAKEYTRIDVDGDKSYNAGIICSKFVAMGFAPDLVAAALKDVHYTGEVEQHDEIFQRLIAAAGTFDS